jgi:hypothetical protein
MPMIPASVRREHPLYPTSQLAISAGPDNHVKVIGHHAIAEDVYRDPDLSITEALDKRIEIRRLVEDFLAAIASIQHVIPRMGD